MSKFDGFFQLVCGIRFQDSFKIFDEFGDIVDNILYSENGKKAFGERYYTSINSSGEYQKTLCNNSNQNSLKINQSNLILSHRMSNFDAAFSFVKNAISKYIIPEIVDRYELNVNRIGLVFFANFNKEKIDKIKTRFLNEKECKEITDFRFSKKETTPAGSLRLDKSDYINKIVTVGEIESAHHGVSFDYQNHFIPARAEIGRRIDGFFSDAVTAFQKDMLEIIE